MTQFRETNLFQTALHSLSFVFMDQSHLGLRIPVDGDLAAVATEILREAEAAVTRGAFTAGRGLRDD